jgi:hypothetical protein
MDIKGSDYIDINNGGNTHSRVRAASALANLVARALDTLRLDMVTRRAYLKAFKPENAGIKFELYRMLAKNVEEQGGRLVVVLFPLLYEFDAYPFTKPHETIRAFCEENNIAFLDLLPVFSKYKAEDLWAHPTDHHPNEIAHKLAAKALLRFLDEKGLVPEPRSRRS